MIVPDVNLLLYAVVDGFEHHDAARDWWVSTLSGPETVGMAPVVVHGFLRLVTSGRVLAAPMPVQQAVSLVEGWLERPPVRVLASDGEHVRETMRLLTAVGAAGNLTTDAQIAAHALRHSATVASNDTDFARFTGLLVDNPLMRT